MFSSTKKDYYSVNANISLSPRKTGSMILEDTDQLINQTQQMQGSPQHHSTIRDPNTSLSPQRNVEETQQVIVVNQLRYEDVYYPRTDKRMISKA